MKKGMYDFNDLLQCKLHLRKHGEVICSGYIVVNMFNFCMAEGVKITVEKISETEYKFLKS